MSIQRELIDYANRLKTYGLVSIGCNKGSISIRDHNVIYATPSGLDYELVEESDINQLDINGKVIYGIHKVSMDTAFHLSIYKNRRDVNAIVHTHSRYATALGLANRPLPMVTFGVHLQLQEAVKCAEFYVPSDPRVNEAIVKNLGEGNAVLLKNHGAITVGTTVLKAFENMVFLEETAESYVHAYQMGSVEILSL